MLALVDEHVVGRFDVGNVESSTQCTLHSAALPMVAVFAQSHALPKPGASHDPDDCCYSGALHAMTDSTTANRASA